MRSSRFWILCACQVLGVAALEMGMPFLPALLEEVGVHQTADLVRWTGWAQGAAFILSLAATPFWGRIADATGRKRMLLRAYAGLAASLWMLSAARTPLEIVLARAVQGALAGLTPAALAMVCEDALGKRRIALLTSCTVAGALLGPLLGGCLLASLGASGLYFAGALVSAACLAGIAAGVPEVPGRGALSAGESAWRAVGPTAMLAAWITGLRSLEDPLLSVYVRHLCGNATDWGVWAGWVVAAARLSGMLAGPLWARLAETRGTTSALRRCVLGASVLTAAQALAPTALALAGIRFLLGAFSGGLGPLLQTRGCDRTEPGRRAEAIAITASGGRLGSCLANAGAGACVAFLGPAGLFVLAGAGMLAAIPWLRRTEYA